MRTWAPDQRQKAKGRRQKVSLALLLAASAACASSDPDAPATVTIGFTGPLSGGAALYGRNVLDGLEMAIADINDVGGITVGGKQVKFAVAPLDDRYFPNESATNAKRLVHQYSAPVVFCPHSGGILAIQGFNASSSPPFIVGAYSSEPQIVESGNPLTLMIPPKYVIYFDAFAQTMIERHGKRLGRIPGAHAYAKEWTKGFSEVWKSKGGELLTNNEVDYNTTTDFSSVVSKALSEKPDVLFVGGPSQTTALVIKAAREQGFKGGFVVMDQAKFEEMNKLVPMEMLENSVGVMPMIHHPDFRAAKFVEKYRQKKGADRDPPREVSLTYGAMRIVARAMELAGNTSDARAIHAKADEAAATLPDEFKPSELLGVDAKGHLKQVTVAAHVVGGKFLPLRLEQID
ncbi:MAG TPA: ABC transporter substrate-binding protein [Vicinamibacterales bacterium]|nr:ABC transporter substrate-binding protein [Vicinamibacterales bacterium]